MKIKINKNLLIKVLKIFIGSLLFNKFHDKSNL